MILFYYNSDVKKFCLAHKLLYHHCFYHWHNFIFLQDGLVKPELRDILKEFYTAKAADKWQDIGIVLGIKTSELDQAVKSARNRTSQSYLQEMFKLYLQKDNPLPSWAAIAEALEFVGEETLAAQVKSKYCRSQSK